MPELILFAEGDYASERLSAKFADLWPDFLAYVISFSTLGAFWVALIDFPLDSLCKPPFDLD